jgi:hypothetical protein
VDRRLCNVALTECAGALASAPLTVILFPALTLVAALIESAVLWQSDVVALVLGAVMPATAITATAAARMPIVPIVSAFLMVLLRRPAGSRGPVGRARDGCAVAAPS